MKIDIRKFLFGFCFLLMTMTSHAQDWPTVEVVQVEIDDWVTIQNDGSIWSQRMQANYGNGPDYVNTLGPAAIIAVGCAGGALTGGGSALISDKATFESVVIGTLYGGAAGCITAVSGYATAGWLLFGNIVAVGTGWTGAKAVATMERKAPPSSPPPPPEPTPPPPPPPAPDEPPPAEDDDDGDDDDGYTP